MMVDFLKRPKAFATAQPDRKKSPLLLPKHNLRCMHCHRVMQLVQVKERYGGKVAVMCECEKHGTQSSFITSIDFTTEDT